MTDKPRKRTRRTRESYAEEQARLAAEAVDRWVVIVADRPPLSEEQIQGLAVILNRIEARLARERAADQA